MKTASSRKITAEASQNARLMRSDQRLFPPSPPVDGRGGRRRFAPRPSVGGAGSIVLAMRHRVRAAGMEAAPARRGRSGSAPRPGARSARGRARRRGLGNRHRRQERPRVRVPRSPSKTASRVPQLDDLPEIHDGDAPRPSARTIARSCADEEHREAEVLLEILEQVDDLGLDRDVERADRLVRDDEPPARAREPARSRSAGAGRPRTHAETAARRRGPGSPTRSSSSRTRPRRCPAGEPIPCAPQRLGDDVPHLHARVLAEA